jgi:hypothetical protein
MPRPFFCLDKIFEKTLKPRRSRFHSLQNDDRQIILGDSPDVLRDVVELCGGVYRCGDAAWNDDAWFVDWLLPKPPERNSGTP